MRHIYPAGGVRERRGRRDRDLLFASTTMGVTRCRKEVGGEVTNYSSLSAALFLRGSIPPTESRGAGTEFLSSIHHKAAATMLTTSFRHRGRCRRRRRFVLPAQKFTTRERSLLSRTRRRSLPVEKQPTDCPLARGRLNSRVIVEIYNARRVSCPVEENRLRQRQEERERERAEGRDKWKAISSISSATGSFSDLRLHHTTHTRGTKRV